MFEPIEARDAADVPALPANLLPLPAGQVGIYAAVPFVTGEQAHFFLYSLQPGERVSLYGSRATSGPQSCPPPVAPTCLDLVGTATRIANVVANANGVAVVSVGVPNVSTGPVALQAVTASGGAISEAIDTTIYAANGDADTDGLTNYEEVEVYGTDPGNADTDGGGQDDGEEITNGTDPLDPGDDIVPFSCPTPTGSLVIGPTVDLYGFCWYLGTGNQSCDAVCAATGGTNLAVSAESSFGDSCSAPSSGGVAAWFFTTGGNPGGWASTTGTTSAHSFGYGYPGNNYYGKCNGTVPVGAYPGESAGTSTLLRQLVCPCFTGTP